MHIVGTPSRIVVPVSVMKRSVSSGWKRSTIATAAPAASVARSPVERPSTCENGAAPSTTSSGPSSSARRAFSAAARMLPCVRTAPFERPDVPEVKRITARVAGPGRDGLRVAGPTAGERGVDEEGRARLGQSLLDLDGGEQVVQRHEHGARAERAEVRGDAVGAVREPHGDAVAGGEPACPQLGGRGGDAPLELAVGDRAAVPDAVRAGQAARQRRA